MSRTSSISQQQFDQLIAESQVLATGKRGPRLLETKQGEIIKVFPQRKWVSTNRLYPYAKRFMRNARLLGEYGFPSIEVTECQRLQGTATYLVKYPKLPGDDLRHLFNNSADGSVWKEFAGFMASLHERGIFFRGIHLGNVLRLPEGSFVLIDITTVKFRRKALSLSERVRNLQHLMMYPEDVACFKSFGLKEFKHLYCKQSGLNKIQQQWLEKKVC